MSPAITVRGSVPGPTRYPYFLCYVRVWVVDVSARVTSKGQVTIPKTVRDALELREGDEVLFRVERSRALIAKTPSLLDLAGSVPVPAGTAERSGWPARP